MELVAKVVEATAPKKNSNRNFNKKMPKSLSANSHFVDLCTT
jgi:hypothetical protein